MSEKTQKKTSAKKDEKKEKIQEMEAQITALEETVAKDKDDYLRLMAEFDNYRRRTSQLKHACYSRRMCIGWFGRPG